MKTRTFLCGLFAGAVIFALGVWVGMPLQPLSVEAQDILPELRYEIFHSTWGGATKDRGFYALRLDHQTGEILVLSAE